VERLLDEDDLELMMQAGIDQLRGFKVCGHE